MKPAPDAEKINYSREYSRAFWEVMSGRTKGVFFGIVAGILFGGLVGLGGAFLIPALFSTIAGISTASAGFIGSVVAACSFIGMNFGMQIFSDIGVGAELKSAIRIERKKAVSDVAIANQLSHAQPGSPEASKLADIIEKGTSQPIAEPEGKKPWFSWRLNFAGMAVCAGIGALLALATGGGPIIAMLGLAVKGTVAAQATGATVVGAWHAAGITAGFMSLMGPVFGLGIPAYNKILQGTNRVIEGSLGKMVESSFPRRETYLARTPAQELSKQPAMSPELRFEEQEKALPANFRAKIHEERLALAQQANLASRQ